MMGLKEWQVPVNLPLGDICAVGVPLCFLVSDECLEDVLAQCLANELASFSELYGIVEAAWQRCDSHLLPLIIAHVVDILLLW